MNGDPEAVRHGGIKTRLGVRTGGNTLETNMWTRVKTGMGEN